MSNCSALILIPGNIAMMRTREWHCSFNAWPGLAIRKGAGCSSRSKQLKRKVTEGKRKDEKRNQTLAVNPGLTSMLILTQSGHSAQETFAVRMSAPDSGHTLSYAKDACSFPDVPFMPVGSVEFCMAAMRHQGIDVRQGFTSYPTVLLGKLFIHRKIKLFFSYRAFLSSSHPPLFIKPNWPPKVFTGHVVPATQKEAVADGMLTAVDTPADEAGTWLQTTEDLEEINEETSIWASEVVRFISEWRYYIARGRIVGQARYDGGEEDAPVPDFSLVEEAVRRMNNAEGTPAGYVLDFGVLSD